MCAEDHKDKSRDNSNGGTASDKWSNIILQLKY